MVLVPVEGSASGAASADTTHRGGVEQVGGLESGYAEDLATPAAHLVASVDRRLDETADFFQGASPRLEW